MNLQTIIARYPDTSPLILERLAKVLETELQAEDHRRRQFEKSQAYQAKRLAEMVRQAVTSTAADRRIPFEERDPKQFPMDILEGGWVVFPDGDIFAKTRLEELEEKSVAWRVRVERPSDDPALDRPPYWIGGFETSVAKAEGRAAAKLTVMVKDGFAALSEVETTSLTFKDFRDAEREADRIETALAVADEAAQVAAEAAAKTPDPDPVPQPKLLDRPDPLLLKKYSDKVHQPGQWTGFWHGDPDGDDFGCVHDWSRREVEAALRDTHAKWSEETGLKAFDAWLSSPAMRHFQIRLHDAQPEPDHPYKAKPRPKPKTKTRTAKDEAKVRGWITRRANMAAKKAKAAQAAVAPKPRVKSVPSGNPDLQDELQAFMNKEARKYGRG